MTATVTDGTGEVTGELEPGEIGAATLDSHRMTYEEIIAAGINVADPQNSHVYEADIHLFFTPDEPVPAVPLPIYITPDGVSCAAASVCGGGGPRRRRRPVLVRPLRGAARPDVLHLPRPPVHAARDLRRRASRSSSGSCCRCARRS